MRILSLDAVTPAVSVAVLEEILSYLHTWQPAGRTNAELAPAVREGLRTCRLEVTDLDAIAVGVGPGSYTGIRIGIALGKGLAMGAQAPLVGISTLESMAYGFRHWPGTICSLYPLGEKRWAIAVFQGPWYSWTRLQNDQAVSVAEVTERIPPDSLVCGTAIDTLQLPPTTVSAQRVSGPSAEDVALLAEAYFEVGGEDQRFSIQPNYLRLSTPEERLQQAEILV